MSASQVRERTCPYCAEDVRPAAVICPHCRRDIRLSSLTIDPGDNRTALSVLLFLALAFAAFQFYQYVTKPDPLSTTATAIEDYLDAEGEAALKELNAQPLIVSATVTNKGGDRLHLQSHYALDIVAEMQSPASVDPGDEVSLRCEGVIDVGLLAPKPRLTGCLISDGT